MTNKFFHLLLILSFSWTAQALAQGYQHTIKLDAMQLQWRVDGSNLAVMVSAQTKGWVGVGFNPEKMMQGANFIIGYVKEGDVKISDEYGHRTTGHVSDEQRGGKFSLLSASGYEKGDLTTLEFVIPLNSGDKTDTIIDPKGKTILQLAHGPKDSLNVGHSYYKTLEVNLESGAYKIIN